MLRPVCAPIKKRLAHRLLTTTNNFVAPPRFGPRSVVALVVLFLFRACCRVSRWGGGHRYISVIMSSTFLFVGASMSRVPGAGGLLRVLCAAYVLGTTMSLLPRGACAVTP